MSGLEYILGLLSPHLPPPTLHQHTTVVWWLVLLSSHVHPIFTWVLSELSPTVQRHTVSGVRLICDFKLLVHVSVNGCLSVRG